MCTVVCSGPRLGCEPLECSVCGESLDTGGEAWLCRPCGQWSCSLCWDTTVEGHHISPCRLRCGGCVPPSREPVPTLLHPELENQAVLIDLNLGLARMAGYDRARHLQESPPRLGHVPSLLCPHEVVWVVPCSMVVVQLSHHVCCPSI